MATPLALVDDVLDHTYEGVYGSVGSAIAYQNSEVDPEFALSRSSIGPGLVYRPVDGNQKIPASGGSGPYSFLGVFGVRPDLETGVMSSGRPSFPVAPGDKLSFRMSVRYSNNDKWAGGLLSAYINPYFFRRDTGRYVASIASDTQHRQDSVEMTLTVPEGAGLCVPYIRLRTNNPGAVIPSGFYVAIDTFYGGPTNPKGAVADVGISTDARLGIVSDVYSRSREKIRLELARVDSQLIAGERVELDAAAMTASPVVWHWRQITGPAVELEPREASMDFIAPDVDEDTPLRIAVYAASEDGRNRSDWHYFDLTIKPPIARYRASESAEFEPVSPKYVGYDRGKREIWNDVIPPSGFSPAPRREVEILDLGILPDDVQFTNGEPPEVAAAGGIYVDIETGDIYRNFGAGYNETDDTTAAPRTNAWWVNPATGDILEWIED